MRIALTALAVLFVAFSSEARAANPPPLKSSSASVSLVAVVNERLSVVPSTSLVSFMVQPQSIANAIEPLALTTSWNLDPTRSTVVVWAYFSDPRSALTLENGGGGISTAEVLGRVTTGTPRTFTQFSGMTTPEGGGLEIFRQHLTPGAGHMFTRDDTIELRIDLTHRQQIAAGRYVGDLTLVAQAY